MSVRSDFRDSIRATLTTAFSASGIPFEAGKIEGPQHDRDVGCVWWEGKRPWVRDGNEEENFYRVRVLRRFRQDQGAAEPKETLDDILMSTAEALEDALKDVLITAGHQLFTVAEVTSDHERQLVEAQLTAYDRNRSAVGS